MKIENFWESKLLVSHNTMMQKITRSLFLLTIFLLPVYLIRGTVFSMPVNLLDGLELLTIGACLVLFFRERKSVSRETFFPKHKEILIGFGLIFFGTLLSAYLSDGFQGSELGILKSWILLPFLFVFLGRLCRVSFRSAVWLYVLSASGTALVSFWLPEAMAITYDGRLRGWYESPNQLAMYLSPALVLAWFLWREKKEFQKILFFLILLCTIWQTYSLGAFVSGGIAIIVGEIMYFWKKNSIPWKVPDSRFIFGGVSVFLFIVFFLVSISFPKEIRTDRSSFASRMMIWKSAVHIGMDNPIFGIGPGNFQKKYLEYQKFSTPYLEWAVPHPHNVFLAFWLSSGVLGLSGCILLLGVCARRGYSALGSGTAPVPDPCLDLHRGLVRSDVPDPRLVPSLKNEERGQVSLRYQTPVTDTKNPDLFLIGVFCALLGIVVHGLVDTTVWGNASGVIFWIFLVGEAFTEQDHKVSEKY